MKTQIKATKEWGGKARKRENKSLRHADRRAVVTEALEDEFPELKALRKLVRAGR